MADGLLGGIGNFLNADNPAALYGGNLTDPATQRALAWRGMQAATGMAGQLAMPTRMPIPIGAVLGQMGGAIGPGEDAAVKARTEALQGEQYAAQIPLARAKVDFYNKLMNDPSMSGLISGTGGTGTAAPGSAAPGTGGGGSATSGAVASFGTGDVAGTQALLNDPKLGPLIQAAAQKNNIPPSLIAAQIMQESSGNVNVPISPTGNVGLMQVHPDTAKLTVAQLQDPETNINAGAAYLKQQLDATNGDYEQALARYNGGPGNPQPAYAQRVFDRIPKTPGSGTEILSNLATSVGQSVLPPGYKVTVVSGDRPGATVAGTGGPSQHATANAIDIKILGPDGQPIPGFNVGQDDSTGLYGKVASAMRGAAPIDVAHNMAWGGNFGERDNMHIDLGGNRGQRGRLASAAAPAPPPSGQPGAPPGAPPGLISSPDLDAQLRRISGGLGAPGPQAAAAPVPPVAQAPGQQGAATPPMLPGGYSGAPSIPTLTRAGQAIQAGRQMAQAGMLPGTGQVAGGNAVPTGAPPAAAPAPPPPPGGGNLVAGGALGGGGGGAPPPPLVTPPPQAAPVPPAAAAPGTTPPTPPSPPPPNLPAPPAFNAAPPPAVPAPAAPGQGLSPDQLAQAQRAQRFALAASVLGEHVPGFIDEISKLPYAAAEAAAKRSGEQPYILQQSAYEANLKAGVEAFSKQYSTQIDMAAAQYLEAQKAAGQFPYQVSLKNVESDLALRNEMIKGGFKFNPQTNHWEIDPTMLDAIHQQTLAKAPPIQMKPGSPGVYDPYTQKQLVPPQPTYREGVDPATQQKMGYYDYPPSAQNPQGYSVPTGRVVELSPGAKAGAEKGADLDIKNQETVIKEANAARDMAPNLAIMRSAGQGFYTGWGADAVQNANRILTALGDPNAAQHAANYEDYTKNLGTLTRTAVRETSNRAAVQEFNLIGNSLPTPETTPMGRERTLAELQGLNDYRQAKLQAQNAYLQRPGAQGSYDTRNFEANFANQVSPYAFVVNRMKPSDVQTLFQNVMQQPNGRAEVARMVQQLDLIKKMPGWAP